MREGDEAPDFELSDQDGRVVSLGELRGKIVVLYFYPRAGTSGCTKEAERFNELLDEFESLGSVVLGVSTDAPGTISRFAERLGLRFRLPSDEGGKVAGAYGVLRTGRRRVSAERVTFVIDRGGRIARVIRNVRPAARHADEALRAVAELTLGSADAG